MVKQQCYILPYAKNNISGTDLEILYTYILNSAH